jgi:hypothetical protein
MIRSAGQDHAHKPVWAAQGPQALAPASAPAQLSPKTAASTLAEKAPLFSMAQLKARFDWFLL